jgi:WD40 repeat protein
MPSPPGSEVTRRRLFTAGTSHFTVGIRPLDQVPAEIDTIRRLFAAMEYQADPKVLDPDHASLLDRCNTIRRSSEPGDVLVAYFTSHGIPYRDRFYFLASNSDSKLENLVDSAIPAEELARHLIQDSNAVQVLIILDMCYAGDGLANIARLAGQLAFTAGDRDPVLFVIAAAGSKQTAEEGAFVSALAAVLDDVDERVGGKAQEYLQMGSLITEVNEQLGKYGSQKARWSCLNPDGDCFAFPNPNYRSNISPGLDLETHRAFEEHWIPKARNADIGVAGWYFTGREQALRELVDWFNKPRSDGRARVVTGSAGSGKSALLARLVTLSDPQWREEVLETSSSELPEGTVPPAELVNAAVVLRRKLLADVVSELAKQLHIKGSDATTLRENIRTSGKKTVLVFDALDEADERQKLIDELLRPLAEITHVFLLLGTRPDPGAYGVTCRRRVECFGEASEEMDLDDPLYGNPADVETYVKRRLLATEEPGRSTPYQASPDRADAVARAVASRCGHSFLVVRTAVTTLLARSDAVDIGLPGWQEQLPRGFGEALVQFLQQLDHTQEAGLSGVIARAALLPLAFAEGEGLPWERIWAQLATAISAIPINDEQIAMLREQAAPFIVEALENGGSVYRLFHERAAEYLRSTVDQGQAQAAIVTALRDQVPTLPGGEGLDWPMAHPYIHSHLPAHALKANQLGALADDELFLAACDPPRLLSSLMSLSAGSLREVVATYEMAFNNLQGLSIPDKLAYLELSARLLGCNTLANAWQNNSLDRTWTVAWVRCTKPTPHRRIPAASLVYAVAIASLEGRFVIVSGGEDKTVRVWDLASGDPILAPIHGHQKRITAIAVVSLAGRPVIISGSEDKTLRVWDLASGDTILPPIHGHHGHVTALTTTSLAGRPVIVSGSADRSLRVWDLESGEVVREVPQAHVRKVRAVATAIQAGRPVIVSGGDDNTVRVWDMASGKQILSPMEGHQRPVRAVATASLAGRPVIVSGGDDNKVRVWELDSGKQILPPMEGHQRPVRAVATASLAGRPVIVSSGDDQTVRVWDLETREPVGAPLQGHDRWVRAVGTTRLAGCPFIISGGDDKTLRVWDLDSGKPIGATLEGHDGRVSAVAIASFADRTCIVSGSADKSVRVWDLGSGEPIGAPIHGHQGHVTAVVTASVAGRPIIVSGGDDRTVRVWDLDSGDPIYPPLKGHQGPVRAVTTASLAGRTVIVSGGDDRSMRVWDLDSGNVIRPPLQGHQGRVTALATAILADRPVIVSGSADRSLRVWDLKKGKAIRTLLEAHDRWVQAVATSSLEGRPVIISGGDDRTVRVWDLDSGDPIYPPLKGHQAPVRAVTTASLAGRTVIVSGGDDRSMRVWDLVSGEPILELPNHIRIGTAMYGLAWSHDTLVVAGEAGLLAISLGNLQGSASD